MKRKAAGVLIESVTLRIKKKYFDLILSGAKTVEYRAVKPYYNALLVQPGIQRVMFHYQKPRRLRVTVRNIVKIKTPSRLRRNFGPYVWEIKLGRVRRFYAKSKSKKRE